MPQCWPGPDQCSPIRRSLFSGLISLWRTRSGHLETSTGHSFLHRALKTPRAAGTDRKTANRAATSTSAHLARLAQEEEEAELQAEAELETKLTPAPKPRRKPMPVPVPAPKSGPSYDKSYDDEDDDDEDQPPFKRMRKNNGMKATATRQLLAELSVNVPAPKAKATKTEKKLPRGYDPTANFRGGS